MSRLPHDAKAHDTNAYDTKAHDANAYDTEEVSR